MLNFEDIYEEITNTVNLVIYKFRDRLKADRQDLEQELFIKIFNELDKIEKVRNESEDWKGYVYVICLNCLRGLEIKEHKQGLWITGTYDCTYMKETDVELNLYDPFMIWYRKYLNEHYKKYYQNNKEKILEYQKQYRQEHEKEKKEYQKQYREQHKEEIKNYNQKYYQDNKEKILEYQKQYYQNNKEAISGKNKDLWEKWYENNVDYKRKYSRAYGKKWRQENKEKVKEYREKNKDKYKEYSKRYYQEHKEEIKEKQRQRRQQLKEQKSEDAE